MSNLTEALEAMRGQAGVVDEAKTFSPEEIGSYLGDIHMLADRLAKWLADAKKSEYPTPPPGVMNAVMRGVDGAASMLRDAEGVLRMRSGEMRGDFSPGSKATTMAARDLGKKYSKMGDKFALSTTSGKRGW